MAAERVGKESAENLHEFTTIGIVGPLGSGKSTAGEFLQSEFGLAHFTVSDMLKRLAVAQKIQPPFGRKLLGDIYAKLVEEVGEAPVVKLSQKLISAYDAIRTLGGNPLEGATIDGLRYMHEATHLKKSPNSYLVAITADENIRYDRIIHRERTGDVTSWAEFKEKNDQEMQELVPIFEMADLVIENNHSPEALEQQLIHFAIDKTHLF